MVTIVFLPISAISSLFAMNTSDFRNMASSQWLYWAVTVTVMGEIKNENADMQTSNIKVVTCHGQKSWPAASYPKIPALHHPSQVINHQETEGYIFQRVAPSFNVRASPVSAGDTRECDGDQKW